MVCDAHAPRRRVPQCRSTSGSVASASAGGSSGLNQPTPDGVSREFDTITHPELVENILAVPLDRLDADEEHASAISFEVYASAISFSTSSSRGVSTSNCSSPRPPRST